MAEPLAPNSYSKNWRHEQAQGVRRGSRIDIAEPLDADLAHTEEGVEWRTLGLSSTLALGARAGVAPSPSPPSTHSYKVAHLPCPKPRRVSCFVSFPPLHVHVCPPRVAASLTHDARYSARRLHHASGAHTLAISTAHTHRPLLHSLVLDLAPDPSPSPGPLPETLGKHVHVHAHRSRPCPTVVAPPTPTVTLTARL